MKWKNSVVNCEAYSSFEGVFTDHRSVRQKYDCAYERMPPEQYDWALLNNMDIREKYVIALRNKFDALQEKTETHTPNDEYKNFVNANPETVAKYILTKHRTKSRIPWETLAVRENVQMRKLPPNAIERTLLIQMPRN